MRGEMHPPAAAGWSSSFTYWFNYTIIVKYAPHEILISLQQGKFFCPIVIRFRFNSLTASEGELFFNGIPNVKLSPARASALIVIPLLFLFVPRDNQASGNIDVAAIVQ